MVYTRQQIGAGKCLRNGNMETRAGRRGFDSRRRNIGFAMSRGLGRRSVNNRKVRDGTLGMRYTS